MTRAGVGGVPEYLQVAARVGARAIGGVREELGRVFSIGLRFLCANDNETRVLRNATDIRQTLPLTMAGPPEAAPLPGGTYRAGIAQAQTSRADYIAPGVC